MKKIALILSLVLTLALLPSALADAGDNYITAEAAQQAAFAHAGVAVSNAKVVRVKLDWDNGRAEYEVEFYVGNTEYDYEIDAVSGQVLKFDSELETPNLPAADGSNLITEEEAKTAAFAHAQVSPEDVTLVLAQLDRDDGKWQYEVEFYLGNTDYDYEIDAQTGTILSFDQEIESKFAQGEQTATNTAAASGDIGREKAKAIALAHAGLTESGVTRLKVEKDRDAVRTIYEVDFQVGNREYSYDIDAASGKILERDVDVDDDRDDRDDDRDDDDDDDRDDDRGDDDDD